MNSRDVILGIIGFGISFFGGAMSNQIVVVSGILVLILTLWLDLSEQEDNIINAQINTQNELKKIWRELDELKLNKKR